MAKQEAQIDYRRELELVERADGVIEIINNSLGKLAPRYRNAFLTRVEKIIGKESRHFKKMSGIKGGRPVYQDIRARFPGLDLKPGELVSVNYLANKFNHNAYSTLNILEDLQEEFDFNIIHSHIRDTNPRYIYVLKPVSEESYPRRIPIVGKPVLDLGGRNFIEGHSISVEDAIKLGVTPTNHDEKTGRPRFYNFGTQPKIIRECLKELTAKVRKQGYTWGVEGHRCSRENGLELSEEEGDDIFTQFIKKTCLPIATLEGEVALAYHPKMIRQHRRK